MTKTLDPKCNPALNLARDRAAARFTTTKRIAGAGLYKSSIGSFPASLVVKVLAQPERK